MANHTTSQIVAQLPSCDPNKLEGMVKEAIEKTVEKANWLIGQIGSGNNPVGANDFDRFCRLVVALEGFVSGNGGGVSAANVSAAQPMMPVGGGIKTPEIAFDEKQMDDEIVKWASDASVIRKLKTYRYLNIEGMRMTTVDYEIQQEVRRLKGQP